MMKFAVIAALACAATTYAACDSGYWGTDCNNVCGMCVDKAGKDVTCAEESGFCPSGCKDGWENKKGSDCAQPTCFGSKTGCSEGGKCVAANYCICGEQGAQVVGKDVERDGVKGVDCVSLRKDGFKGALIAMVVMFVSIGICGGIERLRNKGKRVATRND